MRIKKSQAFAVFGIVILMFGLINLTVYLLMTQRLGNNYSGTDQIKMIDVKKYLPFEEGSELAKVDSSLKLKDDLPVLDGAAALVPVYASVINDKNRPPSNSPHCPRCNLQLHSIHRRSEQYGHGNVVANQIRYCW